MSFNQFKHILVQGRALKQTKERVQYFPDNWQDEFSLINKLSFDGIESIYDKASEKTNPILFNDGRNQMVEISNQYSVDLENIVFDWFLKHPILEEDNFSIERKYWNIY